MTFGIIEHKQKKGNEMLSLPGDKKILYVFIITPNLINVFLMPSGQIILKVNKSNKSDT